ncbi:F0F1-type ATP synthase assembly protein I [Marmoricola sp. OAE513]|uniref:hypothetical protein n=1 Tax=Marmoricola sp. OAE513 TaxID=2817894 RepID=UPI001AE69A9C
MNETTTFRRVAATLTIGSFSIAALMGILALLGAGGFGEREGKVLLTTLVVGAASVCVLCYLATAGTRWAPVGVVGGVVALLPTITALVLVWSDWSADKFGELVQPFGVGVDLSLTLAQICLLLALAGARKNLALVLWGTIAMAALNAVLVSGLIVEAIDGDVWQLLGIVAILDVLGTLVVIALAKFSGGGGAEVVGADDPLRPTLTAAQSAAIRERAAATGRSADEVVAEAVDGYLAVR